MLLVGLSTIIIFFLKNKKTAFNIFLSVYSLLIWLLPLTSFNLGSLHRYTISIPIYYMILVYGLMKIKDHKLKTALQIGFFMLNFVMLLIFASGKNIWLA